MTEAPMTDLRELLKRCTPGPWSLKHVSGSNFAVQAFDIRAQFGSEPHVYPIFNRDTSSVDGAVVYVSPDDAALIAQAPTLAQSVLDLTEENARLREAVEWYGENARLCRLIHSGGDSGRHALAADGGSRASAALSAGERKNSGDPQNG